jgi:hypothetical protein
MRTSGLNTDYEGITADLMESFCRQAIAGATSNL